MSQRYVIALSLLATISTVASADHSGRKKLADKHAPAGIMGDHLHEVGEWMVEYKYMNMYMDDNRIGETTVSDATALGTSTPVGPPGPGITIDGITTNQGATPTNMTMEMHMTHLMYGATEDITVYTMLMLPSLTMDHTRANFTEFTTHNSGFGDTAFGALLNLASDDNEDLIFNLGCTVPTGDIYRESSIPTGSPTALPYPMRLGSGTFNFRPGLTYKYFSDSWSWGAQFQTDLPIGRNYRGYSVGEEFRINTWSSYLLSDKVSVSWRGEHVWQNEYDGFDPATNDALISTNVESFRGGYWYNMGFGAQANLNGHYLNAEVVPTIRQDLHGIQLETDFAIIGSWSKVF
tara:strand:- start:107454 stop:108500 length:1047 start_codon:yes stop_codon:yes gene_type:complete